MMRDVLVHHHTDSILTNGRATPSLTCATTQSEEVRKLRSGSERIQAVDECARPSQPRLMRRAPYCAKRETLDLERCGT